MKNSSTPIKREGSYPSLAYIVHVAETYNISYA